MGTRRVVVVTGASAGVAAHERGARPPRGPLVAIAHRFLGESFLDVQGCPSTRFPPVGKGGGT